MSGTNIRPGSADRDEDVAAQGRFAPVASVRPGDSEIDPGHFSSYPSAPSGAEHARASASSGSRSGAPVEGAGASAASSLRTLPEIGEVTIDPNYDCPGAVEYEADGTPFIVLREYDERVLLHECIHAIFARESEARSALSSDQEERIIRHLTRALYVSGWRLRVTDRSIAQVEHELNETARQRDALAREIDGGGTRDYDYEARG